MATEGSGYGDRQTLQSVGAAFRIVEWLDEAGPSGVTDVAEQFEMPKSTAHVYLTTLADLGYVLNDGGTYAVSLKFLERGGRVRHRQRIFRAAKTEVDRLADLTGELANLGTTEHSQRVVLYKAEGGDAVHDNTPVGEFTAMHWSALGKAMLAEFRADRVDAIVEEHGLATATEHSIETREALAQELELTRRRGYALEDEERRLGMRAVAVPLLDDDNSVIASLSVSGPKHRFGTERIEDDIVQALESAANVIQLQYVHD